MSVITADMWHFWDSSLLGWYAMLEFHSRSFEGTTALQNIADCNTRDTALTPYKTWIFRNWFVCHTYSTQRPLSVVYLIQLYTLYVDLIYNQNDDTYQQSTLLTTYLLKSQNVSVDCHHQGSNGDIYNHFCSPLICSDGSPQKHVGSLINTFFIV